MKFDLFNWNEEKTNVEIQVGKGLLRLLCSAPCPLYLKAEGFEVLAGYGASFDLDVSEAVTFRVEAPKGVRVFREVLPATSFELIEEVFTNIDRMPDESGTLAEITRAGRMLKLEQQSMLREMRAEMAHLNAARAAAAEPVVIDPAPAPEVKKADSKAEVTDDKEVSK